jgi:hypothetical protein
MTISIDAINGLSFNASPNSDSELKFLDSTLKRSIPASEDIYGADDIQLNTTQEESADGVEAQPQNPLNTGGSRFY